MKKKAPQHVANDDALAAAIAAAAGKLPFDNTAGSLKRQCTLGLFVAALADQLTLSFPHSADSLRILVFTGPTASPAAQLALGGSTIDSH